MKLNIVIVINYFSVGYFSITMFKMLDTEATSDLAPLFKVGVSTRGKIQPRPSPALNGFYITKLKLKFKRQFSSFEHFANNSVKSTHNNGQAGPKQTPWPHLFIALINDFPVVGDLSLKYIYWSKCMTGRVSSKNKGKRAKRKNNSIAGYLHVQATPWPLYQSRHTWLKN